MEFEAGCIYHIYNRGNKKQRIFFRDENYLFFIRKMSVELLPYCEILAYCLMPNHFHFVVYIKPEDTFNCIYRKSRKKSLNNAIAVLLRSYTRSMQHQENFTGSLFQQKTKAKELTEVGNDTINYLALCVYYVHLNPLNAKIVKNLGEWRFSSYLDYVGSGNGAFCNKALLYSLIGIDEKQFILEHYRHRMTEEEIQSSSDDEHRIRE